MAISDMPMLSALRTKMQWHQERQKVLADNVSHSDSPGFKPRDLVAPTFDKVGSPAAGGAMGTLPMMKASGTNILPTGSSSFDANSRGSYETRPSANAVNLEDEMMKVSTNQMDYAAATSLYTRSLRLMKTAIGKS
ncbi:MAG: flagellar basal-body rod protein FlgB [Tardiphaga sp.]|jgi:flagellar basal-body rod protein FlgB|nr:flagellar basal-body rod protein FlgB [Tardiphaga sp.]